MMAFQYLMRFTRNYVKSRRSPVWIVRTCVSSMFISLLFCCLYPANRRTAMRLFEWRRIYSEARFFCVIWNFVFYNLSEYTQAKPLSSAISPDKVELWLCFIPVIIIYWRRKNRDWNVENIISDAGKIEHKKWKLSKVIEIVSHSNQHKFDTESME